VGGSDKGLPERIGINEARELIYTGRVLNGREAVEFGLADARSADVLPPGFLELLSLSRHAAPRSVFLQRGTWSLPRNGIEAVLEMEAEAILHAWN
jgi:enoyl-CoA hydratase